MSESTPANTIARERVDKLATKEPQWLKQSRVSAWEAYLQTPMPTIRDEDWHKTEIDSLNLSNLQAADLANGAIKKSETAPQWLTIGLKHLSKRSGVLSEGAYKLDEAVPEVLSKQGVIFCSLKEALQKHADLLKPYIEKHLATASGAKFVLMNNALFNAGTFLYIPKNVVVDAPFVTFTNLGQLGHNGNKVEGLQGIQGIAVFPRLVVVLEANSKADLVNVLTSEESAQATETHSLVNTSIEVYVRTGAKLNYLELQRFSSDVFAITRNNNEISKDGSFYSLTVGLGGFQLKSDFRTDLVESGAASDIQGIIFGDESEHYSFNTIQDHDAPSTTSNINFHVALKDQSTSIYQGIIKVDKKAQKTDSFQSNKNLLLGKDAKADSIPKLEILADDVKCAHGATVGPVDKEQIFYLQSRGLTASESEELIVSGFFHKVLETCPITGAIDWIDTLIADKIYKRSSTKQ
jgi:Fe-S cluster assembly protein SufD